MRIKHQISHVLSVLFIKSLASVVFPDNLKIVKVFLIASKERHEM